MDLIPFHFTEILPDLLVYKGAVNTGILKWGERAILIDCDDTLMAGRLEELGVHTVERIYCTQHRRPNTAGIPNFNSSVYVPQNERSQFEGASAYWQDWGNRWHLYHCRPGPLAPLQTIPIQGTVSEGEVFQWGSFTISVIDTPGMTDGAVSYIVDLHQANSPSRRVVFSGDVLYGHGQIWDVHSLQKSMGTFSDYHGFLGATKTLIASLVKLAATPADCLIPSHGLAIADHPAAAHLTVQRLEHLFRNYASISALNFYFPHLFQELKEDPWRMAPAVTIDLPDFIRRVAATSFAICSETGAIFLVDCGYDSVLEKLAAWKEQGSYTELEGCWVTHYHDDHVDSLHHLATAMPVPIYADEHFAEILTHPSRYFLPCISPVPAPVAHTTSEGETWRWREFELTALHFPGQTLYHGGLLVHGHGMTVLFSGDSFSPAGLDDYTAGNRNLLGTGKTFYRCINLVRKHHPDLILNQHQGKGFRYTDEQLDYMEHMLIDREALLAELLPWDHPNFGIDEGWIRAYPYEVETCSGTTFAVEVRATNHADQPGSLAVEAVLPPGWQSSNHTPVTSAGTEWEGGSIVHARVTLTVPPGTPSGTYPVAFRITWNERYLGQVCHGLIKVVA